MTTATRASSLSETGGDLLGNLSRRNVRSDLKIPDGVRRVCRQLEIILDGLRRPLCPGSRRRGALKIGLAAAKNAGVR
jgi:hypothetical protein